MGAGGAHVFGVPESTPASTPFPPNDQVEHVADGANARAGLPVILARHNARESGELAGKRSGIFSEGGLDSCRLRLRQHRHQSDCKRAQPVLNQNLLHVELLDVYVAKRLVLLNGQYAARNLYLQEK